MEREIFRAKEENFQELLNYKKNMKGQLSGGSLTIRHDLATEEYVLVHSDKSWAANIIGNTVKMGDALKDFEDYLAEGERA
ncbi:MAG: hypothetical protein NC243_11275 [Lachnoclostridium sp.]|nr:hypothetical protein [Lachnoclostridium sp.]MCM1385109.1 hypothetical protein [Lachnoclostridium sp.]